jgi:hypothetical protein
MKAERHPLRLRVEVRGVPEPALLRPAIAARLAGRSFPGGPEDAVGRAVARAVRAERKGGERPWR